MVQDRAIVTMDIISNTFYKKWLPWQLHCDSCNSFYSVNIPKHIWITLLKKTILHFSR